ncbi:MAG TPA: DUF3035 domain-containing protein, partial [Alphaproteobacteria bacterium]|nr:DUF3035 domain-containing protein [Alphaproteobacteria bacterium]
MVRKTLALVAATTLAAGLGACSTLKEQVGLTKRPPDEFTVVTKAPLVIPPDFTLRPPAPGAKRPQDIQPDTSARDALMASAGERTGSETTPATSSRESARAALGTAT